jgi:hypothetical protein
MSQKRAKLMDGLVFLKLIIIIFFYDGYHGTKRKVLIFLQD